MELKRGLGSIAAGFLLLLPLLNSCENINQQNNNKENLTEHLELNRMNDLWAAIETVIEVCELTDGNGMPSNWRELVLGKVKTVTPIDSVFYDGNEIRFELDFGTFQEAKAQGQLPDGRLRFGAISVRIDKYFKEIGSVAEIKFESPFGFSNDEDYTFQGEINLIRISQSKINVNLKSVSLSDDLEKELEFEGDLIYDCVTSAPNNKAWGNEYQLTGAFDMHQYEKSQLEITTIVTVLSPLLRRLEAGCSNTPVSGKLDCKFNDETLTSNVDFDPFENQACDNLVRITQKDNIFDFTVD